LLSPIGGVDLGFGAAQPTIESLRAHRRLLDLLGVTLVLSPEPLPDFEPVAMLGRAYVYRNATAFPRTWTVGEAQPDVTNFTEVVASGELDFRQTALTSDAPAGRIGLSSDARVLEDRGSRVVVEADGPGLLVLSDRWRDGWSARLSTGGVQVLRVNEIMRGVQLPPGRQVVTFEFESPGFRTGTWIAMTSALMVGFLTLGALFAGRRGPQLVG
jgi:hypothetical protein